MYDRTRFQLMLGTLWKGKLLTGYMAWHNRKQFKRLSANTFKNEYVSFIDAETYRFIESHSQHDLFLRQREMLNWILRYPFFMGTHDDANAQKDTCEFGSTVPEYKMEAVKVYVQNQMAGFYIVSQTNNNRTLRYLYYDDAHQNEVFSSISLNLLKQGIEKIQFMSLELQEFMHQNGIKHMNRKSYIDHVALTLPPNMSVNKNLQIQGGDGDMFC